MTNRPEKAGAAARKPVSEDPTLRQFVGYNLKRAYMVILEDLHRLLGDYELRLSTFSALALIADNPGIAQSGLAQALSIERSSTVVVVDDLEGRELISRNKVPGDRRSYALRVTLEGRRLLDRLQVAVQAHEDRLLRDLHADEREMLVSLLNRIERGSLKQG
jgi:DNA-binding MarR family transcriptional regulator